MIEFYTKTEILKDLGYIKPKVQRFGKKKNYTKGDGKLGAKEEILMPDGHGWRQYIPALERQNEFFETMHCTVFNTLNPIETLAKFKWNEDWNKSERYNGVLGGLTPGGGSPHNVAEGIRKFGTIEQSSLPWTANLNSFYEYSSPRPMTKQYLDEGAEWLRRYEFNHDWVVTYGSSKVYQAVAQIGEFFNFISTPEALKDALQYSPLGISVLAWKFRNGKAYKGRYEQDNHWTMLYDYVDGEYWLVYDSYLNADIKLEWNYPISFAKRYFIDKSSKIQEDANYIIDKFNTKNVKGDKSSAVYFIYDGEKHPYPDMEEYNRICDRWFESREFITVAEDALNLIPEGSVMNYDNIASIKPFNTIINP